jgi:hypothetical protein
MEVILDNKSYWFKYGKIFFSRIWNSNSSFSFWWSTTNTGATEEYDGSTWTTNPTVLNTARAYLAGCGTQTAALAFGGSPNYLSGGTATELYDGSTWTSNPTGLNTARNYLGSAGTQTAALAFGGLPTTAATEEWTGPGAVVTKTITTS